MPVNDDKREYGCEMIAVEHLFQALDHLHAAFVSIPSAELSDLCFGLMKLAQRERHDRTVK